MRKLIIPHLLLLCICDSALAQTPNILLIIADDLGVDASSQYAVTAQAPITPNLQSLAARGMVFENFWANPLCSPTRATIMTGRYGNRTGVLSAGGQLAPGETSIQSYIAANAPGGYSNALIGKWHLGALAAAPGFGIQHYAGFEGGGINSYTGWNLNVNGAVSNTQTYNTTELTNQAINWVQQQNGPWFLWLAYAAPHTPFHNPPAGLSNRSLNGSAGDINANPRNYYLAAIEAMDTEIGRLLNSLPAGELNNTVVIFIGDNGTPRQALDSSAYLGTQGKNSLYEGGVRVPLVAAGPGVGAGGRSAALVNSTDLFATMASLAGASVGSINDSVSFTSALAGGGSSRSFIYAEINNATTSGWAIRNGQHKLISFSDGRQELYDLGSDPFERNDLIASGAAVSGIIADLQSLAAQAR